MSAKRENSIGLNRRTMLRASGIAIALPWLESMPRCLAEGKVANQSNEAPKRMIFVDRALGLNAEQFFPEQTGAEYRPSPYLKELDDLRDQYTVISGLSHPDQVAGHASEASFLTSAPMPGRPGFQNTISVDQLASEHLAGRTRIPFLALCSHTGTLSWTRTGVPVPSDRDPTRVFKRLFLTGTPEEVRQQRQAMQHGHSILDLVLGETTRLKKRVSPTDRGRLDQYFEAIRETERRLQNAEEWMKQPKPEITLRSLGDYPDDSDILGRTKMIYDLMHLAISTDSTRLITFIIDANGGGAPPIRGVQDSRHNLSHHGLDPAKLEQLRLLEREELRCLKDLLVKLRGTEEAGKSLLDHTTVFYGSNLGNASSHDTRNLPVLLAGGDFRHGRHLNFDPKNPPPLSNLFVSMLQKFGMEVDRFGSSTGTLAGLES